MLVCCGRYLGVMLACHTSCNMTGRFDGTYRDRNGGARAVRHVGGAGPHRSWFQVVCPD